MEDFFYEFLTDPSLQPFVATSGVYGHISDEPVGPLWESPRFRYLERRLNLSPSLYSFIEGFGMGRVGIRTDIEAVPTSYFEDIVLRSLDSCPSLRCKPATYLERKDWKAGSLTCATHLSLIERKLREFHQARGGPQPSFLCSSLIVDSALVSRACRTFPNSRPMSHLIARPKAPYLTGFAVPTRAR